MARTKDTARRSTGFKPNTRRPKSSAHEDAKSPPPSKPSSSKGSKKSKKGGPMSAEKFIEHAEDIEVSFGEDGALGKCETKPTVFSSGSYGWKGSAKVKVTVDGVEVTANVSLNISVPGTKPSKEKDADKPSKRKASKVAEEDGEDEDEDVGEEGGEDEEEDEE